MDNNLLPIFNRKFNIFPQKSKITCKYILIGLVLIVLFRVGIAEASEIARIKILDIHHGMLAKIISSKIDNKDGEFYEINSIDGEYRSKNGVNIPKKYIDQLKESLSDKAETQGFHSVCTVTDVFSYEMAEILWENNERTILRSTSVGVPLWNILEEGRIYLQKSGKISSSLNKIIATIKGEKNPEEAAEPKSAEWPSVLGNGEVPSEINDGYLGFMEFGRISWHTYLEPEPTFSMILGKNIDMEIEKAVLQVNGKLYPLQIESYEKEGIKLAATLKDITASPASEFKGEITIWYKRNGTEYITDGIVNGFWRKDWKNVYAVAEVKIPESAYESQRWILDFRPVVESPMPTREGKARITFKKPEGKIQKISLVQDCSYLAYLEEKGLTLPCNIISEDDQTVTISCNLKGIKGVHEPGEKVKLCFAVTTDRTQEGSWLEGVWLADFSENMDKYLKIYYYMEPRPGFEVVKSIWRKGNDLELLLKTSKEIEILRVENGYSDTKKVQAGGSFTLYAKNLRSGCCEDFDDSFYPQDTSIEFIYRDIQEKFAYPGRVSISKYAVKKE